MKHDFELKRTIMGISCLFSNMNLLPQNMLQIMGSYFRATIVLLNKAKIVKEKEGSTDEASDDEVAIEGDEYNKMFEEDALDFEDDDEEDEWCQEINNNLYDSPLDNVCEILYF